MELDIYDNSFRNWRIGASEYRKICQADGMGILRAWWRYLAIIGYGLSK